MWRCISVCQEELNFKTIKIDFKQNNIYECILLKIKPKSSKHFYLSTIYCPPNKITEFKSRFDEELFSEELLKI
jgi:hypothetical protein